MQLREALEFMHINNSTIIVQSDHTSKQDIRTAKEPIFLYRVSVFKVIMTTGLCVYRLRLTLNLTCKSTELNI